ncbi:hypothetical protein [Nocardia asiatica]|uniref:hypothetical protein n=1 Tax=Nocardia asiatica TaxID=209252 RepID=UPI0005C178E3|nr:hypothetical protein [Nocardia asiatica]
MTGHDPLAALEESDAIPSPWESLARHARWLADRAEECAALSPADLAPSAGRDFLAELDQRALAVVGAVATCRRATWQQLADEGLTRAEIGRRWGVTRAAVSNALSQAGRPR